MNQIIRISSVISVPINEKDANNEAERINKVVILVQDINGDQIDFVLFGKNVALASLFGRGESIAVSNPLLNWEPTKNHSEGPNTRHRVVLGYSNETMVYLIPKDTDQELELLFSLSKTNNSPEKTSKFGKRRLNHELPRNEDGIGDLTWYLDRMAFNEIPSFVTHLTLIGTVTHLTSTEQVTQDHSSQTRMGVRIKNEDGCVCDITFWGIVAVSASRLKLGQVVVIHNLATYHENVNHQADNATVYIIGSTELNTKIYNS